jgi:tetratricopeptide (TPR) repeat protein
MIDRLLELGDEMTLARAWGFLGRLQYFTGEARLAETSYARAVELTRRAGNAYYEHEVRILWAGAKRHGAAPVEETAAFVETLKEVTATSMGLEAHRLTVLAALDAMRGRFDESRAAFDAAERMEVELGLEIRRYTNATEIGRLEKLAGDVAPAIEIMRRGYDELGRLGETGFRSTLGTSLAAALVDVGRDEEAEALLVECEPISQAEDFDPQARIRATRARILARRGDFAEAERLAREALAIMEPTDYLDTKAETLLSFAEVLETAGRVDDAADALDQALALFEEKGNVVMAGQTREHLDLLRADAPA